MSYRSGFIVGKFSPLHEGHLHVIDTARRLCQRVYVVSYSKPELAGCTASLRSAWLSELRPDILHVAIDDAFLRARFGASGGPIEVPHNDDPPELHRRFCAYLCRHLFSEPIDAVFSSESYGEPLAEVISKHGFLPGHPVIDHRVDEERQRFPISATLLRNNFQAHAALAPAPVRAFFARRFCFLGGESTGKSTLSLACAQKAGGAHVAEYGRTLWEERGGLLTFPDMLSIARRHVANEDAAARSGGGLVFCDTSPLTTLFYSQQLFGNVDTELHWLAGRRYDQIFLCAPDFPFVQDGTRVSHAFREQQHAWYLTELHARGWPYIELRGSLEERASRVGEVIAAPLRK